MPNWKKVIVSGSDAILGTLIVSGAAAIGTASLGPNENTLTLGARDNVQEGGQLGLNASGGTYTSASFIDNWQNQFRILRGTNAGSDSTVANFNLHTKQVQFPQYQNASSFVGTATANLAVDSNGNIITVSTTGGSVFPYTGTAGVTGSISATQAIYSQVNGGMYFQGGDDAALYDINVVNTMGIYGVQDSTIGSIKLGSGGGTISGKSSNIGIGTTNPTSASLTVNNNIWATSITGSLTGSLVGALIGTASWATNATVATGAQTASWSEAVITVRSTTDAVFYPTFVDSNNGAKAVESVYTGNNFAFNPATVTLGVLNVSTQGTTASVGFQGPISTPKTTTGATAGLHRLALITASGGGSENREVRWATDLYVNPLQGILYATSVTASGGFTGSLAGSASYALTASYALNGGGGTTFPYTGSAIISSSLVITGSLQVGVPGTNAGAIDTSTATLSRGSTTSVDWANRELYDSAGTFVTLNWESRQLLSNVNSTILDWESSTLNSPNYVALEYSSDQYINSQLFSRQIIPGTVQRTVTNTPTITGQIVEGTIEVAASTYDILYLETDGIWKVLKNQGTPATKMVGICVDQAAGLVLLEGEVPISDDNSQGAYITGADHGLPVYLSGTNGIMTVTVPTADVVRIVGHIYFQSTTDANWWLMKFRPSNDWYQI